jgi:hypothetical protein
MAASLCNVEAKRLRRRHGEKKNKLAGEKGEKMKRIKIVEKRFLTFWRLRCLLLRIKGYSSTDFRAFVVLCLPDY